jgi:hypothetical protein
MLDSLLYSTKSASGDLVGASYAGRVCCFRKRAFMLLIHGDDSLSTTIAQSQHLRFDEELNVSTSRLFVQNIELDNIIHERINPVRAATN